MADEAKPLDILCKDFEVCGNMADGRYDLDYRDIDPKDGMIHFCAKCGPFWHKIEKALHKRMAVDDEFTKDFAKAVEEAELEARKNVN